MTDGKPTLTYVTLNNTDVTSYVVTWEIKKKFNEALTSAKVILNRNVLSLFDFDEDNITYDIEIYRGISSSNEKRVFKGETLQIEKDGVNIVLNCANELNKLKRIVVVKSWDINIDVEAGEISAIWENVVQQYGGITASAITSNKTLTKWVSNHKNAFTNAYELCNIIDWQMYYDDDDGIAYLEPKGTESQSTPLVVGTNVQNRPIWKYDKTSIVNKVKVIGSEQEVTETEVFNGDGTTSEFTLYWTPKNTYVTVGGVEQIGGNETSSGSFDYTIDTQNKIIIFEDGSIPSSGTANIVVEYSHMLPRPVILKNSTSITNNGLFEIAEFRTDLKNIDDAKEFGRGVLSKYSSPFVETTLKVIDVSDLQPGQIVNVIDNANNINASLLISEARMVFPYYNDELKVGDKTYRLQNWGEGTSERIARLEQENAQNQDKLLHIFDFDTTYKFEPRYFKINKQDIGDAWVVGHPTNSIVASSIVGGTLGASTTSCIIQGNNTYDEYCYDEIFLNSSSSSAVSINTTTKEITISPNGYLLTNPIFVGQAYSYATVSTNPSTFTIQLSTNNGGAFQTLNNGIRTVLNDNTSTTAVIIKISSSTTAVLINEYNTDGSYKTPMIKCFVEE